MLANNEDEEQKQVNDRLQTRKRRFDSSNDEDQCKCRKKCSKRSCSCLKSSKGCSSSCGCKSSSSCQNLFNQLDYFFGENSQCSAHPCFANWLFKNVKNLDDLQKFDRDHLRKRIVKSSRFVEFCFLIT